LRLDEIINSIYPLDKQDFELLESICVKVSYPKGYVIYRDDKVEQTIGFIGTGICRAYYAHEKHDITFWFGSEGSSIYSLQSYADGKKSYENLELLEDCKLYLIPIQKLRDLYQSNIQIANWGRVFAEQELKKAELLFLSRQFRSATDRYLDLLKNKPDLIRRVQLGHIASYLGISQVTLSRIRADLK